MRRKLILLSGLVSFLIANSLPMEGVFGSIVRVTVAVFCVCLLILCVFPDTVRRVFKWTPGLKPLYPHLNRVVVALNSSGGMIDFIPIGQAIERLVADRPCSEELAAISIRDQAAIGVLKCWGRRKPEHAIPLSVNALEEIPSAVWSYAEVDLGTTSGRLPTNKLRYRYGSSAAEGVLYEAVRLDEAEFTAFLRHSSK